MLVRLLLVYKRGEPRVRAMVNLWPNDGIDQLLPRNPASSLINEMTKINEVAWSVRSETGLAVC